MKSGDIETMHPLRLALYQPDMPSNTGTLIRLTACLGVGIDIIQPCGFIWDDRKLQRAGMDYLELANITRHDSWEAFLTSHGSHRLILMTTKATTAHTDFSFRPTDIILMGQESCGVPPLVHERADARITIPMAGGARSINMAVAAAIGLSEALRQTGGFTEKR